MLNRIRVFVAGILRWTMMVFIGAVGASFRRRGRTRGARPNSLQQRQPKMVLLNRARLYGYQGSSENAANELLERGQHHFGRWRVTLGAMLTILEL
jgi:hypothetical protein